MAGRNQINFGTQHDKNSLILKTFKPQRLLTADTAFPMLQFFPHVGELQINASYLSIADEVCG